jgi:murein L,D-transpeptidase YcbB/YkuD
VRWEEDEGAIEETWSPAGIERVMGVEVAALRAELEQRLGLTDSATLARRTGERDRHMLVLYGAYGNVPLWLDEDGLRARTRELVNALEYAHTDGLRIDAYPIAELRRTLGALRETDAPTAGQLVEADLLLTSAYVALASDMFTGQIDPRSVSQGWHIDAKEMDVDSALVRTLRMEPLDRGIARMRPQREEFDELRRLLERYREIVAAGGWPSVPEGEVLEPGDTAAVVRLEALLARLRVEEHVDDGVHPAPLRDSTGAETDRAVYDAPIAGAVARFQARHAIVVDSILGGGTLASLNASAEFRLRQIAANLERYRWLPRQLGDRYVFVNVPAFRLEAYDGGEPVLDMKVIVGSEYDDRATPAFSDSMSYVVFRPYWNVPKNIALDEILPKAQADPGYMARNGYEVVRGQSERAPVLGQYAPSWSAIESGAKRIRQRPGGDNSLGLVKFMFPNDFAIYLHDTPAQGLFERDVRAFSHGCIRVEQPARLAQYVLGWDLARIEEAMASGPNAQQVVLERKIPVYIMYLTTFVRDGELHFGNDLYGRDETLVRAVAGAAMPDTAALAEVRALREVVE